MTEFTVLHAPSPLDLKPSTVGQIPGVWKAPETLLSLGRHSRIGAHFIWTIEPPAYQFKREVATGLQNVEGIGAYSRWLAAAVAPIGIRLARLLLA